MLVRWVPDNRGVVTRVVDSFVDLFTYLNSKRSYTPSVGREEDALLPLSLHTSHEVLSPSSPLSPPAAYMSSSDGIVRWMPQIVILDCGGATKLSKTDWRNLTDLFHAFLTRQNKQVGDIIIERTPRERIAATKAEEEMFKLKMKSLLDDLWMASLQLRRISLGKTIIGMISLSQEYKVPLDPVFTTRLLGTVVVEALSK